MIQAGDKRNATQERSTEKVFTCGQCGASSGVREEDEEGNEATLQGWSAEDVELARCVFQKEQSDKEGI
tara:strand:+ start:249 stop:455 length:207 start_codon:yes stop_codon:yes gene_type:complete